MVISETAVQCAKELQQALSGVDEDQIQILREAVLAAKKVYVAGAGRSLLMLRCIAMRFMHIGLNSFVVGDTTTPAFEPEDLLLVASTSGETSGLVLIVQKAKKIGGKLFVITASPNSTLAKLADGIVVIPTKSEGSDGFKDQKTILPAAGVFEQSVLLLGDALVVDMMEVTNTRSDCKFARHANLE